MAGRFVYCLIAIGALAGAPCRASTIGLQIVSRADATGGVPRLSLNLANTGDEAAHSVKAEAQFQGATVPAEACDALGVNEKHHFTLPLADALPPPGVYPVIVIVRYADANGYPFSAISVTPLAVGPPPAGPEMTVGMLPAEMFSRGTLSLRLRAAGGRDVDARLRVVVPDEMLCSPAEERCVAPAAGIRVAEFALTNVAARPDSRYPVFGIVEYDEGGRRRTAIRSAVVSIVAHDSVPKRAAALWPAVVAVLLAAFIAAQWICRFRGKPAPDRTGAP